MAFVIALAYLKDGLNQKALSNVLTCLKAVIGVAICTYYAVTFDTRVPEKQIVALVTLSGIILVLIILDITFRVVGNGMALWYARF